jgi:subtilisin family serine protease
VYDGERSAPERRSEWLGGRDSNIGIHEDDGRGYLYIKDELLVVAPDLPRLKRALESHNIEVGHEGGDDLGVLRLQLEFRPGASRLEVPEILAQIRAGVAAEEPQIRVGPNHVLAGEPEYEGGPFGPARPAKQKLGLGAGAGKGVRVAVLDTGYTRRVHPALDSRVTSTGTPELDAEPHDGRIDFEAGHGMFVAGLVLRRAPRARVEVVEVLGPAGYGNEHAIAHAILTHAGADVINLSLGGYADRDHPPWALDAALRKVRPETAIVAAAGNNRSSRPMWPAAFKRVIAVGAVDRDGDRASFSNFGWWVDACANAVDLLGPFPRFTHETHQGAVEPFFEGWAIWSGTSFAAPKVSGEIAARLSTGRYATARDAAFSLVNDPTRPHVPDLGTMLIL